MYGRGIGGRLCLVVRSLPYQDKRMGSGVVEGGGRVEKMGVFLWGWWGVLVLVSVGDSGPLNTYWDHEKTTKASRKG